MTCWDTLLLLQILPVSQNLFIWCVRAVKDGNLVSERGCVCDTGGRGFYLKREGVLLNQALIQAAIHHGHKRGLEPVMTPFFMRQEIMGECAQLEQFDEELYKVTGKPQQWIPLDCICLHLLMVLRPAHNTNFRDTLDSTRPMCQNGSPHRPVSSGNAHRSAY